MRHFLSLLLVTGAMLSLPPRAEAKPTCDIEHTSYAMAGRPDVEAGFRRVPKARGWISDLAFYVKAGPEGPKSWFLFDQGSSRYVSLISTEDVTKAQWHPPEGDKGPRPLGSMHFLSSADTRTWSISVPDSRSKAPKFILLPDLSEVLWYRANPRADVPTAVLEAKGCK